MSSTTLESSAADGALKSPTFVTPPPITTDVKPVRYSLETATPQAQNLQEILYDAARLRSSSASSLERKLDNAPPLLLSSSSNVAGHAY